MNCLYKREFSDNSKCSYSFYIYYNIFELKSQGKVFDTIRQYYTKKQPFYFSV
nr:MAG TPA: hypothetical protein [Caudoviricetes sp.]